MTIQPTLPLYEEPSTRKLVRKAYLPALACLAAALAGCGGGAPRTPAPTNLVYPQAAIAVTLGQAITADMPTVTGTVTSYSVSPTLPAGVSLSTSTGAISGTPTAASAQTSYTITATNVSGSTTATVQITVNPAAPTNLVYPVAAITATVGQAIATDTPTVTGTVTTYSVSPRAAGGLEP